VDHGFHVHLHAHGTTGRGPVARPTLPGQRRVYMVLSMINHIPLPEKDINPPRTHEKT